MPHRAPVRGAAPDVVDAARPVGGRPTAPSGQVREIFAVVVDSVVTTML
jgi:hypothetical protein